MVPARLSRFFWDTKWSELDTQRHARYIIERLLERGDVDAIRWVLSAYARPQLIDVVKRSRSLSRRSANFWAYYFDINRDEVPCIKKSWPSRRQSA